MNPEATFCGVCGNPLAHGRHIGNNRTERTTCSFACARADVLEGDPIYYLKGLNHNVFTGQPLTDAEKAWMKDTEELWEGFVDRPPYPGTQQPHMPPERAQNAATRAAAPTLAEALAKMVAVAHEYERQGAEATALFKKYEGRNDEERTRAIESLKLAMAGNVVRSMKALEYAEAAMKAAGLSAGWEA